MGWLADLLMGKKPIEWKYIGYVPFRLSRTTGGKSNDITVKVLLFMTDDGQRKWEHTSKERGVMTFIEGNYTSFNEIEAWVMGAGFPKDFVPEPDTLAPMLSKLIDNKILGESK